MFDGDYIVELFRLLYRVIKEKVPVGYKIVILITIIAVIVILIIR